MSKNIFDVDFQEFILALNQQEVEYLLVGGYAVILHGYNRTTGDLDIWVNPTKENYIKLKDAFYQFGLPIEAISPIDFLDTDNKDVFTFGRPPLSIDLLTKVKGLEFIECIDEAKWFEIEEGLSVRAIHVKDLIKAKKAAGRFRDLDDIENLMKE